MTPRMMFSAKHYDIAWIHQKMANAPCAMMRLNLSAKATLKFADGLNYADHSDKLVVLPDPLHLMLCLRPGPEPRLAFERGAALEGGWFQGSSSIVIKVPSSFRVATLACRKTSSMLAGSSSGMSWA